MLLPPNVLLGLAGGCAHVFSAERCLRLGSDIDAALAADMASTSQGTVSGAARLPRVAAKGMARLGGRRLPAVGRRYECGISHGRRLV